MHSPDKREDEGSKILELLLVLCPSPGARTASCYWPVGFDQPVGRSSHSFPRPCRPAALLVPRVPRGPEARPPRREGSGAEGRGQRHHAHGRRADASAPLEKKAAREERRAEERRSHNPKARGERQSAAPLGGGAEAACPRRSGIVPAPRGHGSGSHGFPSRPPPAAAKISDSRSALPSHPLGRRGCAGDGTSAQDLSPTPYSRPPRPNGPGCE